MDIILIAGMFLDGSAWDAVVPELRRLGHRPIPLTLPSQTPGSSAALDNDVDAVLNAVDATTGQCVVVGHSVAATLAFLAADRRPTKLASAVLIGGFPSQDGAPYAPFFEPVDGVVAFPGWDAFDEADAADLSDEQKALIAENAVVLPASVAYGRVHYEHESRHATTPVVVICPEFTPEVALAWIDGGGIPELAPVDDLTLVNIDSGHWPMFTQPETLAELIADCAVPRPDDSASGE